MRVCYIDCFSGVAGDMLLAALLDVGGATMFGRLIEYLNMLDDIVGQWNIRTKRVLKSDGNISANYIYVESTFGHEAVPPPKNEIESNDTSINQDGDDISQQIIHIHDHSHGIYDDYSHNHNHNHEHYEQYYYNHEHNHDHDRGLFLITNMIQKSNLPEFVKKFSISAFTELAYAEAKVHGTTLDRVHFHEVGAIDSIVDTVGVVIALYCLNIDIVYCSTIPMSSGTVWSAHGLLPVPAPATLNLMRDMILSHGPKTATGELVTPTGASLVRALCGLRSLGEVDETNYEHRQGCLPPSGFRLQSIGVGAGTKEFPKHPNILRVLVGEVDDNSIPISFDWDHEQLYLIETNVDDSTAENIAYLQEMVLSKGANDCWTESIGMKKSRAAIKFCVLVSLDIKDTIIALLFQESVSIGIRITVLDRVALRRRIESLTTFYGTIRVKISSLNNRIVTLKPEYEDCRRIAAEHSLPLKRVMDMAKQMANDTFEEGINSMA